MTNTKTKRSTYAKQPTARVRAIKNHRNQVIALFIISTLVITTTLQAYHYISLARAIPQIQSTDRVHEKPSQATRLESPVEKTNKEIVYQMLEQADIPFDERIHIMSVINCESRFKQWAINKNTDKEGSLDLGIVQWNTKWHPEVSRECAFDIRCAVTNLIRVYEQDGNMHQWTCNSKI